MSLVPFGGKSHNTTVDINDGQSTQTFTQNEDSEYDVDVGSTSSRTFSTIEQSFDFVLTSDENPDITLENLENLDDPDMEIQEMRVTADQLPSGNTHNYTFTTQDFNGNSIETTSGASYDSGWVSEIGSFKAFVSVADRTYLEGTVQIRFSVATGSTSSTVVNSITQS